MSKLLYLDCLGAFDGDCPERVVDNLDCAVLVIFGAIGVKYILNLDYGGEPLCERCCYGLYNSDDWRGMNALKGDDPSLKVVLLQGDCRLCEIQYWDS